VDGVVGVVVDVDASYRPLGAAALHIGVRRSPLREPADVVAFVKRIAGYSRLRYRGVMAYEAQIAGVGDSLATRPMKRLSRAETARRRAEIARALTDARLAPAIFNGGGTGSVRASAREAALTEVTAGSGFLCPHLFDRYADLALTPAAYFALEVARAP